MKNQLRAFTAAGLW